MRLFEQYGKICKYFAEGSQKDNNAYEVQKHLQLHNVNVGEYLTDKYALWLDFRTIDENLTDKYALWLDFRTIDENFLHGMGRKMHQKVLPYRLR